MSKNRSYNEQFICRSCFADHKCCLKFTWIHYSFQEKVNRGKKEKYHHIRTVNILYTHKKVYYILQLILAFAVSFYFILFILEETRD